MAKSMTAESLCNVCKSLAEEKSCLEQQQRIMQDKCKEQLQTIQKQQECQSGAFDEQESFMLSRQCNTELGAFYSYLSLFAHYDRDDVALKGFSQLFLRLAYEELEHALKLIRYTNKRGGRTKFCEIRAPEKQNFGCVREAIQVALEVEKRETTHLMELHGTAKQKQDHHLCQYLARDFMDTQLESMNDLGCKMTQLNLVGDGAGLYLYDRNLQKDEKKRNVQKYI